MVRPLMLVALVLLGACSENEQASNRNELPHKSGAASSVAISSTLTEMSSPARPATNIAATMQAGESKTAGDFHMGISALGMSFDDLLKHFDYDSTEEREGYLLVSKKGDELFWLNDKNYLKDKIVRNVVVTNPNIAVQGKLRVGMTVQELQTMFPGLLLYMDYHDNAEFFAPPIFQNGTKDFPDARVFLNVTPNGDGKEELANEKSGVYPTEKYSKNGRVVSISILLTGNANEKP